jgi:hypothetical protein
VYKGQFTRESTYKPLFKMIGTTTTGPKRLFNSLWGWHIREGTQGKAHKGRHNREGTQEKAYNGKVHKGRHTREAHKVRNRRKGTQGKA